MPPIITNTLRTQDHNVIYIPGTDNWNDENSLKTQKRQLAYYRSYHNAMSRNMDALTRPTAKYIGLYVCLAPRQDMTCTSMRKWRIRNYGWVGANLPHRHTDITGLEDLCRLIGENLAGEPEVIVPLHMMVVDFLPEGDR